MYVPCPSVHYALSFTTAYIFARSFSYNAIGNSKTKKEDQKDLDYIIKCKTCDMKYVGETGQQFRTRNQQMEFTIT